MSDQAAFRLGDGAPVGLDAAHAIWTAVTREVLDEQPPGTSITHRELARLVQQRSGVYTRAAAPLWLPAVLVAVGDEELTARVRADAPQQAPRTRPAAARRPRAEPKPPKPVKRQDLPPAICPRCFMQLPASGRCDICA